MRNTKTKLLAEGAVMIALAAVLSFVRIYKLPWGGSVTLLSMLPIVVFSIRHDVRHGLAAAFLFACLQFFQGMADGIFGWGLTPVMLIACILLDYMLPFTAIGMAGLFRKRGIPGWIAGTVFALGLRFGCHFASGVIIWRSFGELWGGFFVENPVLYSLLYNASYMLPEMILTCAGAVVLFKAPQTKEFLK